MYAVIKTGGKQYQVKVGDVVFVEKIEAEAGAEIKFNDVLAIGDDGKFTAGAPTVEGAKVTANVLKNGKAIDNYNELSPRGMFCRDAEGNTHCTGVIAYSLSKYCLNNANGNMGALAQATAMYGYYAAQYFTN